MSAPVSMQAAALRVLSGRITAHHLIRNGVASRKSEADHLVLMLKEAATTLSQAGEVSK